MSIFFQDIAKQKHNLEEACSALKNLQEEQKKVLEGSTQAKKALAQARQKVTRTRSKADSTRAALTKQEDTVKKHEDCLKVNWIALSAVMFLMICVKRAHFRRVIPPFRGRLVILL